MSRKRKSLKHMLPKIIERDGGVWKCHYCGAVLIPSHVQRWTKPYYNAEEAVVRGELKTICVVTEGYSEPYVDHKHPVSKGGSDNLDNLVAACRRCNQAKLDTPYDEYIKRIKGNP